MWLTILKSVDTTKIDKKQIKRGPTQLNFKLFCIIKYPTFFLTDMERESIRTDAKTLSNLRSEHARLKDDFRSLFTSNDRIKTEYCNLQSDYKTLKTTHNQLKLAQTELKGTYIYYFPLIAQPIGLNPVWHGTGHFYLNVFVRSDFIS